MRDGQARPRSALITGISGQDGSYLAELLLQRGYHVIGLLRPHNPEEAISPAARAVPLGSCEHLRDSLDLLQGDLLDRRSLEKAVAQLRPDELYHLAAPSFVPDSWQHPAQTLTAIAGATAILLEAVRDHSPHTRVFIASSGAIFGSAPESPQNEQTACQPETPYATAKLAAHQITGQMRSAHSLFACSGILYNHESERRPERFVSRKVTRAAAQIKRGLADTVTLGDMDAVRDWSFAGDVMLGAWLALQQDDPDDYVLASGEGHTVAELAEVAFAHLGLDAQEHITVDPALQRAAEPTPRIGDPSHARRVLGWQPTLNFEQLIARMVERDLATFA